MLRYTHNFNLNPILSENQILEILEDFELKIMPEIIDIGEYYKGDNTFILERVLADTNSGAPNNKITISYGRKIITTITGYMFKPGFTTYNYKNISYENRIVPILKENKEIIKTSLAGRHVSTYGFAYELHYIKKSETIPRFTIVKPEQVIPIYNYDIEPTLGAVIRFYKENDRTIIIIYYSDFIFTYERNDNKSKGVTRLIEIEKPEVNLYKQPPFVVYENNQELIGEIKPIKKLIDAYDILCSDSMNEFDRFAWAYLLMTNQISVEDAKKVKQIRIIQDLENTDAVKFLIKEIPHEYIQFMKEWVKSELHEQSHIPDFINIKTGELTGAALDRLLYDFEFVAATKEVYFKKGLYDRFKLIDKIINISDDQFISNDIEIEMKRNRPADKKTDAEIYNILYNKGITEVTLMRKYLPWIENPEEEFEDYQEGKESEVIEIPDIENIEEEEIE